MYSFYKVIKNYIIWFCLSTTFIFEVNGKVVSMYCQVENGTISYIIEDHKVCITGFEGSSQSLVISETIDGVHVCGIAKKAFLGNRSLQHIILPETIEWIGDWAFCNCAQLQRIEFPRHPVRLGKGLFAKDERLYEINCGPEKGEMLFPGRLLAMAVTRLDAEYLLDMALTGTGEWYRQLDNRLLTKIMEPAENALRNLVYCAEEDMGAKQEACLKEQERMKAYMALLRLAYPEKLVEETKKELKSYLLDQDGLQTRSAWEAVKDANGKEQFLFCDIMLEISGICEQNLPSILEDLGDTFVELKAHLLKVWEQRSEQSSVWKKFAL